MEVCAPDFRDIQQMSMLSPLISHHLSELIYFGFDKVPQAIAFHEEITNVSNEVQIFSNLLEQRNSLGGSALEIAEEPARGSFVGSLSVSFLR